MIRRSFIAAAFAILSISSAFAQTANGRVTTAPPAYSNGLASPLSLDTAGNLRVNCITGCSGGGGGGNVNITGVGGNTVTTTVPVSGTVTATGPLTDTQLRATPVPVSGTVGVSGTVPVSGPLTDTQLRATAVPVSGTVGVSGTVPVSGPLTDAQLRATPIPVTVGGSTAIQVVGVTGTQTAPYVVRNSPGVFYSFLVQAASGVATTVYDNASACSGTVIANFVPTSSWATAPGVAVPSPGRPLVNGLTFCTATSTQIYATVAHSN